MKVGKVVAAFVMNRPDEEREIAPKLIETQKAVDSGQLANDVIPLGELCRCRHSVCLTTNPKSVHQTSKGVRVKFKDGSSTVWPADHPASSMEDPQNMLTLHIFKRILGFRPRPSHRYYLCVGFLPFDSEGGAGGRP